jgi:hypothetical protein
MEQPEAEIPASEKCGLGVVWELENENMVTFCQYCLCKPKILPSVFTLGFLYEETIE